MDRGCSWHDGGSKVVIPAEAGIYHKGLWTPAFAGVTMFETGVTVVEARVTVVEARGSVLGAGVYGLIERRGILKLRC